MVILWIILAIIGFFLFVKIGIPILFFITLMICMILLFATIFRAAKHIDFSKIIHKNESREIKEIIMRIENPEKKYCPYCGNRLKSDSGICPHCGGHT